MKRIAVFLLIFGILLSVAACTSGVEDPLRPLKDEKEQTETEAEEISETETETETEGEKTVLDIVCRIDEDAAWPDAEEPFFEDERYIYIFGNPISEYVIVKYSDGSEENVKEALEGGCITIEDLGRYSVNYFAEPKHIDRIEDLTSTGEIVTSAALECFYMDEKYSYWFGSIKSGYITVYYKDGTSQNIREALADGKITIADLDWFNISYGKEEIRE
ncbi:MAG: hypothetical protein E7623_03690 [Ruminococcaceae bacterium]|nr:hypothetical protein [Oscillospiraceae bacterium]